MITQSQPQFALHVRAVLGLPLDYINYGAGASAAYKSTTDTFTPEITVDPSLFTANSFVRVFGKPQTHLGRRMALALTFHKDDSEIALSDAKELINKITE